jgi:hypothetical protein
MKKNYYAKALALTVAASMVSVPAFAAEGTDAPQAQEKTVEQDEQKGEKSAIYETKEPQANAFEGSCGATKEDTLEWKLEENDDDLYEIAGEKESEWHFSTTEEENSQKVQATYTLTISGDGKMADYENYSTPWGIAIAKALDPKAEKGSMYKISPRITQIKITGNPTYIGSHAFRSTSIKEITIPASVEKIGNYALIYCRELEEIKLAGDNNKRNFYVEDGVLYENYTENGESGVELRFYPSAKTTGEFKIPEGVTALGPNSMQTGRFSSVTFPDSLRSINSYALCGCVNLTSVTLPDGVTFGTEREVNVNKGAGAFSGCTSLTEVKNFPADIEAIPIGIFQGDVALTSFTIPEGIKELKDRCFSDTGITDITVPASVTTLGNGVFSGKNTEKVTVHFAKGSQLQSVGKNIFNNTSYKAIFDMSDEDAIDAFTKAGYTIDMSGVTIPSDGIFQYDFAGAKKLAIQGFVKGLDDSRKEKMVIPDEVEDWAVTTIAENAFKEDYNKIKEVEIGANVSAIGSYAFVTADSESGGSSDGALEKITFKSGVPVTVGDRAFSKYNDKNKKERIFDAGDREITFGNNVFLTTPLKTVNIPNAKKLGHGVFFNVGCRKDLEVLVINGGAECNAFAFKNSTNGKELTYPEKEEYSFAGTKVYAVNAKATDVADEVADEIKDLAANNILCLTDGGTVDINGKADATTGLLTPKYEGSGNIFGGWYYDVDGTKTKLEGEAVSGTTYTAKWVSGSHDVSGTEVNFEDLQYGYTEVPSEEITVTATEGEATVELVSKSQNVDASVNDTTVTISPKADLDIGNYTETVRIKTGDGATHDIKVKFSVVKAEQTAPAAPEAESITRTSITLKAVEPNKNSAEAEYSIDGEHWQKSPVFDGLSARTTYTFAVRYAETDKYAASVASEARFTTRKKSSSSSSDTSAPTYGVSTGKTENGEISVTPAKAEAGETVTIKATPDSGYQLDKMTVKDKNNSTVKLKKVDDNEYTFTMPVGKVSVDATFVQKDAADDSNAAEAGKTIKLQIGSRIVNVDNEAVIYDAAPVIRNDRTLVPIRIITEALGGKVDWNGATKEVTLSINDKEIKMTIGKTLEKCGVAPVIIDGRTFVPVRFVADELGAEVAWDEATKTVTIKTAR